MVSYYSCYWCDTPLCLETRTRDHVTPKCLAKRNIHRKRQTVLCCPQCNEERSIILSPGFKVRKKKWRKLLVKWNQIHFCRGYLQLVRWTNKKWSSHSFDVVDIIF